MSSTYRAEIVSNRPPQVVDLGFFGDVRFDPSDTTPDFIGLNVACGASTANTDWKVYKFFYADSTSTGIAEVRLAYGTWAGRATLTGF